MLFTIGFTQKSAEQFFTLLKINKIKSVIDIRANNTSQLAGYAKKMDLDYFLKEILQIKCIEIRELAPDRKLLKSYRSGDISWATYADAYLNQLARIKAETTLDPNMLNQGCLLCSEHEPHYCHRRLAAEYLNQKLGYGIEIKHLL